MVKTNILPIKNSWIVCKRVKKTPYYYRGPNYLQTSTSARQAEKFTIKSTADTICKELNDKRQGKGYKFRVESSEKHFVNDFTLNFYSWNEQVVHKNELKSIQFVTKYGKKVTH